jgi:hypothetical protein
MLLSIYLNDHLAGATVARELAQRAAGSNRDTDYGPLFERLATEIREDREALLSIMDALGVATNQAKVLGGWWGEKLGRLKLNGRLLDYSPLSRVVELEALTLGVTGKAALWRTLETLELNALALPEIDFVQLRERAERQLEELEQHRLRALTEAFGEELGSITASPGGR